MATPGANSALNAFKRILSKLREADKTFGRKSTQYKFLVDQMRDHHITQRVYSKAPEEAEHVANLYATYLSSTQNLKKLELRYRGGERSVEESAKLVNRMAEDFEDAGQKYAFLLRPVKDLGKNFEVDIAKELDEFNFAEAAMLIQGSVFVFGRKVDYVHTQALHFFEAIQTQKTSKKKKTHGSHDDDEGFHEDEAESIDPCDLQNYSKIKKCKPSFMRLMSRKSRRKCKLPKISIMPMSLMPLADFEKNGVLIYSTGYRNEVVGKMDDFKMNSGFLTGRGVLLLQLVHEKIVDNFASEKFMRMWYPHLFKEDGTQVGKPFDSQPLTGSQQQQSRAPSSQEPDSGRGTPSDNFAGGDNARIPSAMEEVRRETNTWTDLHSARPSVQLTDAPEVEHLRVELQAGGGDCDFDSFAGCGGDDSLPLPPGETRPQRARPPQTQPWETDRFSLDDCTEGLLLDPFETVKWKTKPIEKITRFVRGSAVAARLEKAENASLTFQKRTMRTNDYVREHFYMRKKRKTCKDDNWQTDALYRFIVSVMKKRAEAKRQSRKAKAKPASEAVYNEDNDDNCAYDDGDDYDEIIAEEENAENVPPKPAAEPEPEKSVKPSEKPPSPAPVRQSVVDLMFGDIDDDELNSSIDIGSLYGGCGPGSTAGSQPLGDTTGKKRFSLLELLHQHMLKFWSTAEEVTSGLVHRVQEWEDTMMPILEEEETRKEFDIHEYGDELLSMFDKVGEEKTLDELLKGRKKYEISRYFLACLMMANTYNVRVQYEAKVNKKGDIRNVMKITLLKRDRHHEVFDKAGAL
ncbi:hypothetical protein Q1695_006580 [Nippostrongylus brasiliensis]|nr:hypothetical protein Q1695_006580 [Nippostrongylus brasiliensis]